MACCSLPTVQAFQATPPASALGVDVRLMAVAGGLVLLFLAVKKLLDTPSRTYNPDAPNVGDEYDNWTQCAPRRLCWALHTVFSLGLWLPHCMALLHCTVRHERSEPANALLGPDRAVCYGACSAPVSLGLSRLLHLTCLFGNMLLHR